MNGKCRNDCKQSLKGFTVINPGFQPGDEMRTKNSVRKETGLKKIDVADGMEGPLLIPPKGERKKKA
jgi:hypothetical protein